MRIKCMQLVILFLSLATIRVRSEAAAATGASRPLPFAFGQNEGDLRTKNLDNTSEGPFPMSTPINFFGLITSKVYANSNGHVSFVPFTGLGTSRDFPDPSRPSLVAAFWTDSEVNSDGAIWAGVRSSGGTLEVASTLVSSAETSSTEDFDATQVFVATFDNIAECCSVSGAPGNTYQVGLITDGVDTFVSLSYNEMEWFTTGTTVGLNDGERRFDEGFILTRIESMEDLLALTGGTNCNREGTYIFNVTGVPPQPTEQPSNAPSASLDSLPFAFGQNQGDAKFNDLENTSEGPFEMPTPINFFGLVASKVYANSNGHVSFVPYAEIYLYEGIDMSTIPSLVAAFWTYSFVGSEGAIWAGVRTSGSALEVASSLVNNAETSNATDFYATQVFVATFENIVECCPLDATGAPRNTYQVGLITDGTDTFVSISYGEMEWFQYGVSVGLFDGGPPFQGGFILAQSMSSEDQSLKDLVVGSNCGRDGTYVFNVTGTIPPPSQQPSAAPSINVESLPFAFGEIEGDTRRSNLDDTSVGPFELPIPVDFYGEMAKTVYANSNGLVLLSSYRSTSFRSTSFRNFPDQFLPSLVAAFWYDSLVNSDGSIWAGVRTSGTTLQIASELVNSADSSNSADFHATQVFVATFDNLARCVRRSFRRFSRCTEEFEPGAPGNTFQVGIIADGVDTFVSLSYGLMEWFSSETIIGLNDPEPLFGGGFIFTRLETESDLRELTGGTNCNRIGTYIFNVTGDPPAVAFEPLPLSFGQEEGDNRATRSNGTPGDPVELSTPINFFGLLTSEVYVSPFGYISFEPYDNPYLTEESFDSSVPSLAAVFWNFNEVAARVNADGAIWMGMRTSGVTLEIANSLVNDAETSSSEDFDATQVFVATFQNVAQCCSGELGAPSNTFQVGLITDGTDTFVSFSYSQIEWFEFATVVGLNDALLPDDGTTIFARIESSSKEVFDLISGTNCNRVGTYVFNVTGTTVPPTGQPSIAPSEDFNRLPYVFGEMENDVKTNSFHDTSEGPFQLSIPINFYGLVAAEVYANSDGHVSFERYVSNPFRRFPDLTRPSLIAAFWTDSQVNSDGAIWVGVRTSGATLQLANGLVNSAETSNSQDFGAIQVMVATFEKIGECCISFGPRNTYQVGIITDGTDTFVSLSYGSMQWFDFGTTVGLNDGEPPADGGRLISFIDSQTEFLDFVTGTNCGQAGTYVYNVTVALPSPTQQPTTAPTTESERLPFLFGATEDDVRTRNGDNSSDGPFELPIPINFYGLIASEAFANTHGHVSFVPFTESYTDLDFPSPEFPSLIAAFWIYSEVVSNSAIWAGVRTSGATLEVANSLVNNADTSNTEDFDALQAFVVTFENIVECCSSYYDHSGVNTDASNTFQVGIVTDGVDTFVSLSYSKLQWREYTTTIGLNDGERPFDGGFLLSRPETDEDLSDLLRGTNCGREGTYIYNVTGEISRPTSQPSEAPSVEVEPLPFAFGESEGDRQTRGSTSPVYYRFEGPFLLPTPINFYGLNASEAYVNTNGFVSFEPFRGQTIYGNLPEPSIPALVAGYWVGSQLNDDGAIWCGVRTSGTTLEVANRLVNSADTSNTEGFDATQVFVATFENMEELFGDVEGPGAPRNTFQVGIMTDGVDTFVSLSYGKMEWFRFGSTVGFNDPEPLFAGGFVFSNVKSRFDLLDLVLGTNAARKGTYVFNVTGDPVVVPEPLPFPFGQNEGDVQTHDGNSVGDNLIELPSPINFYGFPVSEVYTNKNGYISFSPFDRTVPSSFSLSSFPSRSFPALVAVYWDFSTLRADGAIWAGVRTSAVSLAVANGLVTSAENFNATDFDAERVFVATFENVARCCFPDIDDAVNTFQVALIEGGGDTFVSVSYSKMQWFSSRSSLVGLNLFQPPLFDGFIFTRVDERDEFFDLIEGTNCGQEGTYIFNVTGMALPSSIAVNFTVVLGVDKSELCREQGLSLVNVLVGTGVTYCIEVMNSGDTALTDVVVNAPDIGGFENTVALLQPGEMVLFSVSDEVNEDQRTKVTATGVVSFDNLMPITGATNPTDEANATILVLTTTSAEVVPSIAVENTVVVGELDDGDSCAGSDTYSGLLGDAVTFCINVRNTGNTVLINVTVADPVLGIKEVIDSLLPNEELTFSIKDVLSVGQTNTVTVVGIPAFFDLSPISNAKAPSDSDDSQVLIGCFENVVVDFEKDEQGNVLTKGAFIDDSVSFNGVKFKARRVQRGIFGDFLDGMIFDTSDVSGNDFDLAEDPTRGNILIISADDDPTDPDDAGRGGVIVATFDFPVTVNSIKLIDNEKPATIRYFAEDSSDNRPFKTTSIEGGENGEVKEIPVGVSGVKWFQLSLAGSGAVDDVDIRRPCRTESPGDSA